MFTTFLGMLSRETEEQETAEPRRRRHGGFLATVAFLLCCCSEPGCWDTQELQLKSPSHCHAGECCYIPLWAESFRGSEDDTAPRIELRKWPTRRHAAAACSPRLVKIKEWVDSHDPGALVIPFSGGLESLLQDKSEEERQQHCTEHKTQSALSKIIKAGYAALQLEYFFTAGPDEVRAWTIRKGTKAPQAAGKIHTDFEKGFIMAEVMKFQDFKEEGSESAVKAAGKYRQQGRNYVVEDGDIIFFKFNAPNAPKKK